MTWSIFTNILEEKVYTLGNQGVFKSFQYIPHENEDIPCIHPSCSLSRSKSITMGPRAGLLPLSST